MTTTTARKIAATVAGLVLAAIPVAAHADDPHQPATLQVQAKFYGTCTHWYVAYWGVQQNLKPHQAVPTADVEIDIRYREVTNRQVSPGSYGELHRRFAHNDIPKLVQVYANGVLIRERLFGCGYFRASAS